jgi:predicted chitinase
MNLHRSIRYVILARANGGLMEYTEWNVRIVQAMFPSTLAKENVAAYFPTVEGELNDALAKKKITNRTDVIRLKVFTYATIRAENARFSTSSEKVHWTNTIFRNKAVSQTPTNPRSFVSQLEAMHDIQNRLMDTYALDNPYGKYDYRSDLGNSEHGMGERYKGRGFIQITGKANYLMYGTRAGVPALVGKPELAEDPKIAARIAALYVLAHSREILAALNKGDLSAARQAVNGTVKKGAKVNGLEAFSEAYQIGIKLAEPRDNAASAIASRTA